MTNDPVNYVRQVKQNLSHTRLAKNRKSDFHCERDFFSIPFSFNFILGCFNRQFFGSHSTNGALVSQGSQVP